MYISEIKNINSQKVKISVDNVIAFVLYKGDLPKYGIKEGDIEDSVINDILTELLPKRALNRALKIITGRDMTEGMLKNTLIKDGYPEDIIDSCIERLKKERLLDDERFVRGFIESKSFKKSKKDIMIALSMKGVNSDFAERIYDELNEEGSVESEKNLIRKLLEKRHFDFENADYESIQKEMQYLYRKGFSPDSIHSAFKDE